MDDESWEKSFFDLEMEECHLFDEHDINSLEEEFKGECSVLPELLWENLCFDSDFTAPGTSKNMENNATSSILEGNRNTQQHGSSDKPRFSSCILSFEDSRTVPNIIPKKDSKKGRVRDCSQTQDHIIAERKRREKHNTMFTALSAIIPGLKKTDKLSIINNTIDYVKYLQNRVRDLEEQNKKTESLMVLKNNKPHVTIGGLDKLKLPKVDVSVSGEDVIIIRVICNKQEDIVKTLLSKLVAYDLSIVCSSVLPFATCTLNISIIAKVEGEFSMAMDDLMKNLNEDLLRCCNLQQ